MTNILKLTIKPVDPLIVRDSRPFGQGQGAKARSLDWLTPSVVCGSLRSSVGKTHGSFDAEKLKSVKVRGPFLEFEGSLYFPRPLDFVQDIKKIKENETIGGYAIRPASPEQVSGYTEMPYGLKPALIQGLGEDDFKPAPLPAFWSALAMRRWLTCDGDFKLSKGECLDGPGKDVRTHVGIHPETGASEDSLLFSTTGLDFKIRCGGHISQMTASIEAEPPDDEYGRHLRDLSRLHVIGGERRLAEWISADREVSDGWEPGQVRVQNSRLRMILATPAIFSKGWLPGWIDENTLEGEIPMDIVSGDSVRVRLVSAVIGRWTPISGWSYEKGRHGPKPLRRMTPVGSVYFFESVDKQPFNFDLSGAWLRSVCDDHQDRNDGFGAALWGSW